MFAIFIAGKYKETNCIDYFLKPQMIHIHIQKFTEN